MNRFLSLVGTSLLAACARPAELPALRYLALGDSLTLGVGVDPAASFPRVLERKLEAAGRKVTLSVVARSGATAAQLNEALVASPSLKPDLVTLCIGTNDVVNGGPLDGFAAEFRRTAAWLRREGVAPGRVLVLSLPDWSALAPGQRGDPAVLHSRVGAFNARLAELAAEHGLVWVDLRDAMSRALRDQQVTADGLHPSAAGYAAWVDALWPTVAGATGLLRNGTSKTRE